MDCKIVLFQVYQHNLRGKTLALNAMNDMKDPSFPFIFILNSFSFLLR